MIAATIFIASLYALSLGKPLSHPLQRRDVLEDIPNGFKWSSTPSPSTVLQMRLALVQSDPAGLERALYDVSTPSSPSYGNYLTREEAAAFVAPTSETQQAVNAWLAEHNITATPLTPAGDSLSFDVPVSMANEIFGANFSVYTHEATGNQAIRTLGYSIPADLEGHVDFVHPTTVFPVYKIGRSPAVTMLAANLTPEAVPSSCATSITPACLQGLYGIPTTPATQPSNKIGVAGFIEQYANEADLMQFLERYRPDVPPSSGFSVASIAGGQNLQTPGLAGEEANLDIQYTVGIATNVSNIFLTVGGDPLDGFTAFMNFVEFLLSELDPPQVVSVSYGFDEVVWPQSYAFPMCTSLGQLALRGVSILYASGDAGVSGFQGSINCINSAFIPTFPSTCPYVTSVGGTTGIIPETAATLSSGGFSNYFAFPDYQASAVSSYLSSIGSLNTGKFQPAGRAFPDISAQAERYQIAWRGEIYQVSGTSASTPVVASIIALINDELAAAGKPPLGFLNPLLYANPSVLTDITSGSNPGCGTNGFPALPGWDPVTGLGTPNFSSLRTLAGL
ncbi:family S53 protease [Obba rivulosa]|uniref:tripeptidyl-peptidase II n=1 Tax=Obba rivulosa TaxID=1052685 RepID=A0A8E2AUY7_9APHY|nr:family S53 protease [Obba rivulosa]